MDPPTIIQHARETLDGLDVLETPGCVFLYYDPQRNTPLDRRHPFATVLVDDTKEGSSDTASDLARRKLFRVNLGVERATYRTLFGEEPAWGPGGGVVQTGHDFMARDVWLPHPVYAPMDWICIVSPSAMSWPRVRELLAEAHAKAKRMHKPRGTS